MIHSNSTKLPGRPVAFDDEDLNSLLLRAGRQNAISDLGSLRKLIGFQGGGFSPNANVDQVCASLGVSQEDLQHRWIRDAAAVGFPGFVHWFGTFLPKELVRIRYRRFLASQSDFSHTPAHWLLEVASHCPQTHLSLADTCPSCGKEQPWTMASQPNECVHSSCGKPLSTRSHSSLGGELAADYTNSFALVDPNPSKRTSALQALPADFHDWDGADAFLAVLGFAGAKRGLERAQAGRKDPFKGGRDYSNLTAHHVAFGYRALATWSHSLVELFETFQRTVGSPRYREGIASMEAFLTQGGKQDRVKELVEAAAPQAIRRAKLAFYDVSSSPTLNAARVGFLSMSDARSKFRIDNRTLRRLVPAGACFHAENSSKGGAVLFDESKLGAVVQRYRNTVDHVRAAKALGVPSFVVPVMVKANLLVEDQCPDLALLTSNKSVLTAASLEGLRSKIVGNNGRRRGDYIEIAKLMAWIASPEVWVALCRAIIDGDLRPNRVTEQQSIPPFERLGLPKKDFAAWLKDTRFDRAEWADLKATKADAKLVLNTNDNAIRAAVKSGVLEVFEQRQEMLRFSSVKGLASNWISCDTVAFWEGETARSWFHRFEDMKFPSMPLSVGGQKVYLKLFCRQKVQEYCNSIRASGSMLNFV
jgi:hypothetical protein